MLMPVLELKGLTKQFGGLVAVRDLDLTIEKEEIFGLIGPNGAGKTTVFNMIMGSFPPSKGRIIFKGKEITGQKTHLIVRHGIARSFQRTVLFGEMTVLENIFIGLYSISKAGILSSLFKTRLIKKEKKGLWIRLKRFQILWDLHP